MLRSAVIFAVLALPTAALADRADADACAKTLSGEALKTYRSSIARVEGKATLEQAMRPYLERRHASGLITEEQAREIGTAAAKCMRLVHREN